MPLKPIYLKPDFKLGFDLPDSAPKTGAAYDEYVSDPAKPVPFVPRPIHMNDANVWRPWLVSDQRGVSDRTDVLSYVTEPLKARLQIAGAAMVNLYASTTGTDTDWVVKLIDVYPDEVPSQPELGGYQLGIAMDIFPRPLPQQLRASGAGDAERGREVPLRAAERQPRVLPGHRVMVQIQSSWFPLYDRNPQTYVPNIFYAKPSDYQKATLRVYHAGAESSALELPVVETK